MDWRPTESRRFPIPSELDCRAVSAKTPWAETNAGQRNIISGNSETGVLINTATNNTVSGNYIGTDASGRVAVGNGLRGIFLDSGANTNLIGGDDPAAANVISGNWIGLWVQGDVALAQGNTIKGNFIGTDPSGLNALGNLDDGVYFGQWSQYNYIGPYNIIAFNGGDGVQVDTPTALSDLVHRQPHLRQRRSGHPPVQWGQQRYAGPGDPEHHLRFYHCIARSGLAARLRRTGLQQPISRRRRGILSGGRCGRCRRRLYALVGGQPGLPLSDGHGYPGWPGHFGIFGGLHLDRLPPEPAHDSAVTGRPSGSIY